MGVTIRALAAAVKASRDRGPSVTHRAKAQAAEVAAAEQKKARRSRKVWIVARQDGVFIRYERVACACQKCKK